MGSKNTQEVHEPDITSPLRRCVLTVETSKGEGRERTKEEAQEEDGHPGGGRQTESKGVAKEGGASEETGGAQSRRSTAGPRPHHDDGPWWSRQREEPWRRYGHRLQGGDQQRRSRWCWSLKQRWRANEPGGCR